MGLNLNVKFIFAISYIIILSLQPNLKEFFPITTLLLFIFFPYPILKENFFFILKIFKILIFICVITSIYILLSSLIFPNYDLIFALRTPYYLLTIIIYSFFFFFWFLRLDKNIFINLFFAVLLSEILGILFFDSNYLLEIKNFSILSLILYILIILLSIKRNNKNIFFFFIIIFLITGIINSSQQSIILFLSSILVFLFSGNKQNNFIIKSIKNIIIFYPLLFITLIYLFPNLVNYDSNVAFRLDAIKYNIDILFSNPLEYLRLDRATHPYQLEALQYEDNDSLKNISSHNALIDFFSKTTFVGFLIFIYFINNISFLLSKISNTYNKLISCFFWLYLGIHLCLNQIFRFNQIVILSLILGYLMYLVLIDKNESKN